jgi:GT2 family glycosyltransferase
MSEVGRTMAAIVHFDRWPDVLDTIRQLPAQGVPYSRVLVIDNGSPPDVERVIADECSGVRWLGQLHNEGFGSAVNVALGLAGKEGAERLLVLTHEVRLGIDSLQKMVREMRNGGLAAVGPLVARRSDPQVVWSAGGRLNRFLAIPTAIDHGRPLREERNPSADPVAWLDGCCMLLDIASSMEIGGFFEAYFLYFEDVDFFLRLKQAGKPFSVCHDAIAYQEPGGLDVYLATRNRLLLARRNLGSVSVALVVTDVLLRLLGAPLMRGGRRRRRAQQRLFGLVDGLGVAGRVRLRRELVGP